MRPRLTAFACVLAVALGLLALPAAGARADILGQLPITSFSQIVADPHGHLFLSGNDSVVVTDVAGNKVATLYAGDSIGAMTLSADGSTLYVALIGKNSVSAVSTATLAQTASYQLGASEDPVGVAVQSGKLWVSYDTTDNTRPGIGYFDLGLASGTFVPAALSGPTWSAAPDLAADPDNSGALVAVDGSGSPVTLATYDVASSSAPLQQAQDFTNCGSFAEMAVVPGGAQFILACAAETYHYRYKTTTLAQEGYYATSAYPDAVAIAPDGSVAAGTDFEYAPDIYVFKPGGATAVNSYQFTGSLQTLAYRGLAWSADSSTLYAVVQQGSGTSAATYDLDVIDYPQFISSGVNLTAPQKAVAGYGVTLSGTLYLGPATAPAGIPVTITRTLDGSSKTVQFSLTTAADGTFTVTDVPQALGTYTYTARYAGDSTYAPSSAAATVAVNPLRSMRSLLASPAWVSLLRQIHGQPTGGTATQPAMTGTPGAHANPDARRRIAVPSSAAVSHEVAHSTASTSFSQVVKEIGLLVARAAAAVG